MSDTETLTAQNGDVVESGDTVVLTKRDGVETRDDSRIQAEVEMVLTGRVLVTIDGENRLLEPHRIAEVR